MEPFIKISIISLITLPICMLISFTLFYFNQTGRMLQTNGQTLPATVSTVSPALFRKNKFHFTVELEQNGIHYTLKSLYAVSHEVQRGENLSILFVPQITRFIPTGLEYPERKYSALKVFAPMIATSFITAALVLWLFSAL